MTAFLSAQSVADAQAHAIASYPRESVGVVLGARYEPLTNIHDEPEKNFSIDPSDYLRALETGELRAVIHSHPDGPHYPSEADMRGQIAGAVVWGIIATDGERASEPLLWGDELPIRPLLAREFIHGVQDCMSAVRDVFRLGRDGLTAQGVEHAWPYDVIPFADCPRDDAWWQGDQDLYADNFAAWGFKKIGRNEARAGDVFMGRIRSPKLNHAGVLITNDLIFHHLPGRLSRREPAGLWAASADLWVRYEGLPS